MKNCPEQELQRWDSVPVPDFPDGIDPVWDVADFALIKKLLKDLTGLRILDVGCGTGNSSIFFLRLGAYVVGVDLVRASVEKARSRAVSLSIPEHRYRFLVGNILELDSRVLGSFYDVVFCSAFLHHFFGDEVTQLSVKLAATLKPSGPIIMYENSNRNTLLMSFRWLVRALGKSEGVENECPLDQHRIMLFSRACGRRPKLMFGGCTFLKLGAHYLFPFLMPLCFWGDKFLHRLGTSPFLSYRQIVVFEKRDVDLPPFLVQS